MINIKDLTFAYEKHNVLDKINFKADAGQLVAVLGKN